MDNEYREFSDLGLNKELLRGIYAYGFEKPSIIQQKAIPIMAEGMDLIAQSQSGTGKTGAFTIGMLQLIDCTLPYCQGLILAHTRELATQIHDVMSHLAQYMNVNIILCIGGEDMKISSDKLGKSVAKIIIGTPGRICDMINRKILKLNNIRVVVLDEADELLSENFTAQIRDIIYECPKNAQLTVFTATINDKMKSICKKIMREPIEEILVINEELTLDGIRQYYVDVNYEDSKLATLKDIYKLIGVTQTIIYVNNKQKAEELKNTLEQDNYTISVIHSSMKTVERSFVMKDFRSGNTRILISTDLLARGIDIQQVSLIINYDLPRDNASYIHRIGRSGRFGRKGMGINFVTQRDQHRINEIEKYYRTEIEELPENFYKLF